MESVRVTDTSGGLPVQFNTKTKDQLFCPKCGASIGIDFRENHNPKRYGISVS